MDLDLKYYITTQDQIIQQLVTKQHLKVYI